jgi:glycosyltransferase involved in cell wall biosynthesis
MAGADATPAAQRRGRLLHHLPLPNIKRRPPGLAPDVAVYVWGAVVARGPFITDLDIPYALTGYDLRALPLWRLLLRHMLLSQRCVELRCMSEACRRSLAIEFGEETAARARVVYPRLPTPTEPQRTPDGGGPRFLFVSTQFEIKGGAALLRAFPAVRAAYPSATLDLITHLPQARRTLAEQPGVRVHPATLTRTELWQRFLSQADVLVHPTYVDSFAMVVLEAIAHGLAVIATDVYAIGEMVQDGNNGRLLAPPLSVWDGYRPSALYRNLSEAPARAAALDTGQFECDLAKAMIETGAPERLAPAQSASRALFERRFASTA